MQIFSKESSWEVVLQEVLEGTNLPTFLTLFHKLNSFKRCGIALNYRILHVVVRRSSQRNLKNLHHHHI
jgi:hypothetical protein